VKIGKRKQVSVNELIDIMEGLFQNEDDKVVQSAVIEWQQGVVVGISREAMISVCKWGEAVCMHKSSVQDDRENGKERAETKEGEMTLLLKRMNRWKEWSMSKRFCTGEHLKRKVEGGPASGSHPGNYPLGRQALVLLGGYGTEVGTRQVKGGEEGRYVLMYITAQEISDSGAWPVWRYE
jgi:hypothetical protein